MNYEERGHKAIPKVFSPQANWIYDYYQIIKKQYYRKRSKK